MTTNNLKVGDTVATGGSIFRGRRKYRIGRVVRVTPKGFVDVEYQGRKLVERYRPNGVQYGDTNHRLVPLTPLVEQAVRLDVATLSAEYDDRGQYDSKTKREDRLDPKQVVYDDQGNPSRIVREDTSARDQFVSGWAYEIVTAHQPSEATVEVLDDDLAIVVRVTDPLGTVLGKHDTGLTADDDLSEANEWARRISEALRGHGVIIHHDNS